MNTIGIINTKGPTTATKDLEKCDFGYCVLSEIGLCLNPADMRSEIDRVGDDKTGIRQDEGSIRTLRWGILGLLLIVRSTNGGRDLIRF